MKKLIFSLCVSAPLLASIQTASAFTYSSGNLILVFRDPNGVYPDIEFNVGNLSSLPTTPGAQMVISGWSASTVSANYGGNIDNAQFLVYSATAIFSGPSKAANEFAYVTDGTSAHPSDSTGSQLDTQVNALNTCGYNAGAATGYTSGSETFVDGASDQYSYSYQMNNYDGDPTLAGGTFDVEFDVPGSVRFFKVAKDNTGTLQATAIGNFTLDTNNVLTYTAGVNPPSCTMSIVNNGDGTANIEYGPSTIGDTYTLYGNSELTFGGDITSLWSPVSYTPISGGDGSPEVSVLVTPPDMQDFYTIAITPN